MVSSCNFGGGADFCPAPLFLLAKASQMSEKVVRFGGIEVLSNRASNVDAIFSVPVFLKEKPCLR